MTKRLYRQVMGVLLGEIATGALPPGHRLAPEPELAAHYGVSRGVMRECLRGLEERGMLEVRPGSGTRVLGALDVEAPVDTRPLRIHVPVSRSLRRSLVRTRAQASAAT